MLYKCASGEAEVVLAGLWVSKCYACAYGMNSKTLVIGDTNVDVVSLYDNASVISEFVCSVAPKIEGVVGVGRSAPCSTCGEVLQNRVRREQ